MSRPTDSATHRLAYEAQTLAATECGADLPSTPEATDAADTSAVPVPGTSRPHFRSVEETRYTVLAEMAQGGVGRILQARDESLRRPVAIKQLLKRGPALEQRFMREALLTARLQHPSIVPVYEAGCFHSGEPFYAMKFVSGRPFSEVIAEAQSLDQRLALLPHVLAVAEALAYAHSEGIIHRDLKPHNILLGPFGETVVIDWGLAKDIRGEALDQASYELPPEVELLATHELTIPGAILGTPRYMPPEQAAGLAVDARADVYALGAILYHLLAGQPPYRERAPREVIASVLRGPSTPLERRQRGVPRDLLTIVNKAMARDLLQRYPSAKELAEDLRRFQTGQIVQAHLYSPAERLLRFVRRHRAQLAVLLAALGALGVFGTLALLRVLSASALAQRERDHATWAEKRATERADTLTLSEARSAAARNPVEAIAWLKTLSPGFARHRVARVIAADAVARGVPRILRGHDALVNHALFSPDGRTLATTSDDHTVRLWDVQNGRARVLTGHTDEVWELAFLPDGETLLTGSKDGTVRRWEVATGRGRALAAPGPAVDTLLLAPGGRDLVFRARDGQVHLWDMERGRRWASRELPNTDRGAAFSPDGRTLAYVAGGALLLRNLADGTLRRFPGPAVPVRGVLYSPDGKRLVAGDTEGGVFTWDAAGGAPTRLGGHTKEISELLFLGTRDPRLATASLDGTIQLWDLNTGASTVLSGHEASVYALAASPDGKLLLSGSLDHTARLWEVALQRSHVLQGASDVVSAVAFSPDGQTLAVASGDQLVRLYALAGFRDRILAAHPDAVTEAAVSPDGQQVAAGSRAGGVYLTGVADGATRSLGRHAGAVTDVAFSADGARVASAGADGRIRIVDVRTGAARVRAEHTGAVRHILFSPDGRSLVSAGADGAVRVGPVDGGPGYVLTQRTAEALALALSADGGRVFAGWQDGLVSAHALGAAAASLELPGHRGPVAVLARSPDGKVLASGSLDHTLRLWDAATGKLLRAIAGGGNGVEKLLFFPDGKRLVTLGGELNARIWEVDSGRLFTVLRGHRGRIHAVALSPDGTRLATGSDDGTARLWDTTVEESRVLAGHKGRVEALAFALAGRALLSAGQDGLVRRWMDDLPMEETALRAALHTTTPEEIQQR